VLIGIALLLASCSTTSMVQKRITKNPELFAQLSQDHQLLVQQGRISEGMNKNAVFLAWGPADTIQQGSKDGKSTETWIYDDGYDYGRSRVGVGFGYGTFGGGGGGYGYGVNVPIFSDPYDRGYPTAVVVFTGNRVTEWQSTAR